METMVGKRIKIIFEDGPQHTSNKEGICTMANDLEIYLDDKHIIPRARVLRMEVVR